MNNWKADFSGCLHAMPACCLATFGLGVGTALLQGLTF